jgi:hypothetical protein
MGKVFEGYKEIFQFFEKYGYMYIQISFLIFENYGYEP